MSIIKIRDEFESWVNNSHMLAMSNEPGYSDKYEHAWTRGAWESWKACNERARPEAKPHPLAAIGWTAQYEVATTSVGRCGE